MHVLSGAEVPILKIMFPSAAFRLRSMHNFMIVKIPSKNVPKKIIDFLSEPNRGFTKKLGWLDIIELTL